MLYALTRPVSSAIAHCELTHLDRQPIDLALARQQHHAYQVLLAKLGCHLIELSEAPDLPDSVFVEDTALVLDELAIITRPGAASRRPESASIAAALAPYRSLHSIEAPGTVDGGDLLRLGKTIFVGLSSRSNLAAVEQIRKIVQPYGYEVRTVELGGCLHLKSAVTQIAADTLLINPAWVDGSLFAGWRLIEIEPSEPYAANAVWLEAGIVYPDMYPRTQQKIAAAGSHVHLVGVSELVKAEGAVTCCSLIFTNDAIHGA